MAGAQEKNPSMSEDDICKLIRNASFVPVERDSLYNFINIFAF
jgi:2-iminoacetate synthase ThiH